MFLKHAPKSEGSYGAKGNCKTHVVPSCSHVFVCPWPSENEIPLH